MALEKKVVLDQIEIILRDADSPVVQIREAIVILDDGIEMSRRYTRRAIGWEDLDEAGELLPGEGTDRKEVQDLVRMFVKPAHAKKQEVPKQA